MTNQKEDFPTVDRPDLYEHARSLVEGTWQDRFDKEFVVDIHCEPDCCGGRKIGEDLIDDVDIVYKLKSFIDSEIQLALSKQREEIQQNLIKIDVVCSQIRQFENTKMNKLAEEGKVYDATVISKVQVIEALLSDIKNII